ncbi:hypothetical protein [Chitinophaga skermanii]|uniref:hypothetical protein n=1 Tax=Chitinophaga skermanii TaxID=331697 RepID=UPI0011E5AFFA|nr:hypothetical protein [Chitinophaga skermanii]
MSGFGQFSLLEILFVTFFASPKKVTKERRKNGERLRRRFIGMWMGLWCYCGEGHWVLCGACFVGMVGGDVRSGNNKKMRCIFFI